MGIFLKGKWQQLYRNFQDEILSNQDPKNPERLPTYCKMTRELLVIRPDLADIDVGFLAIAFYGVVAFEDSLLLSESVNGKRLPELMQILPFISTSEKYTKEVIALVKVFNGSEQRRHQLVIALLLNYLAGQKAVKVVSKEVTVGDLYQQIEQNERGVL